MSAALRMEICQVVLELVVYRDATPTMSQGIAFLADAS